MKTIGLILFIGLISSCKSSTKPNEASETISIIGQYCSAFDTVNRKGLKIKVSPPSKRQIDQINKILVRISLPQNFIVYQGKVNNAIALFQNNQNYIILNRDFLNEVDRTKSSYWLSMYLISHEIGHLLSSHLLYQNANDSISKEQELQADYFAGATLSRLGCPLDKAKLIFNGTHLQKVSGSKTHPPSALRMKFIEDGWENNLKSIYTESNPPVPDNIDEVDMNNPNYTLTVKDLNPPSVEKYWYGYLTNSRRNESIGEGIILSLEPLEQDDTPNSEYDDYKHTDAQSDTIQRMMDVYPILHYSATVKVKKWIKTYNNISENISFLKIHFRGYAIKEGDHPLDKYLDLFCFAYNDKKLEVYENHFIEGQPIRFTIEEEGDFYITIDNQKQKTFFFKEIRFLSQ